MKINFKRNLVTLIVVSFVCSIKAQPFLITQSVFKAGGANDDVTKGVYKEPLGYNLYATGSFKSPVLVFGTYTLVNTNPGTSDIFLVKYNTFLNTFLWAKSFGTVGNDEGSFVTKFSTGDICFGGYFNTNTLSVDNFTLNNNGNNDCFIASADGNGNVLWAKSFGGIGNEEPTGMHEYGGLINLVGNYESVFTVGTNTLTNAGNIDLFWLRFNSLGSILAAKGYGSIGNDEAYTASFKGGYTYIGGAFNSSSLSLGTNTLLNANPGTYDAFLLEIDNISFNETWATKFGGIGDEYSKSVQYTAGGVCSNLWVTGSFNSNTLVVGNSTLVNQGIGTSDIFLSGYDASSHNVLWSKSFGGSDNDFGISINDLPFVLGNYSSSAITVDSQTMTNNSSGTSDIFVAGFNCGGTVTSLSSIGGVGNDQVFSGSNGEPYSYYIAGSFNSPNLTINGNTLTNAGANDAFVLKVKDTNPTIGIDENETQTKINLFPNPTKDNLFIIKGSSTNNTPIKLKIINTLGEIVKQEELIFDNQKICIDLKELSQGIYFLQLFNKGVLIKNEKIIKE